MGSAYIALFASGHFPGMTTYFKEALRASVIALRSLYIHVHTWRQIKSTSPCPTSSILSRGSMDLLPIDMSILGSRKRLLLPPPPPPPQVMDILVVVSPELTSDDTKTCNDYVLDLHCAFV